MRQGDQMSFQPENDLERALVHAANDPAGRPAFYRALAEAPLFVIRQGTDPEADTGKRTLEADTSVAIQNIEHNGRVYIPVFSSLARLQAVIDQEVPYFAINAVDFFRATPGSDLLLNPGSEYGKEISAEEAASVVSGEIWRSERHVTESASTVLLGVPKRYPRELADALARFLAGKKAVRRAWIAHFFDPARGESAHTLVALEADRDAEAIIREVGPVIDGVEVPDPPVDFIVVTGNGSLDDYFLREAEPFFTRKRFGLF